MCTRSLQAPRFSTNCSVSTSCLVLLFLLPLSDLRFPYTGGGIETRSITEAFGEFRTGKTQVCHVSALWETRVTPNSFFFSLFISSVTPLPSPHNFLVSKEAVMARFSTLTPKEHSLRNSLSLSPCISPSSTHTLAHLISQRPERIVPIAERFELDPDQVLDNIVYARAYTSEHQTALLQQVPAKMAETQFRMLVESCTSPLSVTTIFTPLSHDSLGSTAADC